MQLAIDFQARFSKVQCFQQLFFLNLKFVVVLSFRKRFGEMKRNIEKRHIQQR